MSLGLPRLNTHAIWMTAAAIEVAHIHVLDDGLLAARSGTEKL